MLKGRNYYTHRLVLLAFVGPCPEGLEGCHNDGDPSNNRLDNLRWDTRESNMADQIKHGVTTRGVKQWKAKLTAQRVREIRAAYANGQSCREIAINYGVVTKTIFDVVHRHTWFHVV
jgi:hypothetical protein